MINKKQIYLLYIVIMILLLVVSHHLSHMSSILLIFTVSIIFSYLYIQNVKNNISKQARINLSDERNEKIRDKTHATMASILLMTMGVLAIICFEIQNYIPATILSMIIFSSPLIMYLIYFYYEKKY